MEQIFKKMTAEEKEAMMETMMQKLFANITE